MRAACAVFAVSLAACTAQAAFTEPPITEKGTEMRNTTGRIVTIAPGRREVILDWESSKSEAELVTIVIAPPNRSQALKVGDEGDKIDAHAIIKYGVDGGQNEIEVDVFPGNMITLPASFVRVEVVARADNVNDIDVSAFVAKGAAIHPPAKRTIRHDVVIPQGNQASIVIPSHARTVMLYTKCGVQYQWSIDAADGTALVVFAPPVGQEHDGTYILPSDAMLLTIAVLGIGPAASVRAVFELY